MTLASHGMFCNSVHQFDGLHMTAIVHLINDTRYGSSSFSAGRYISFFYILLFIYILLVSQLIGRKFDQKQSIVQLYWSDV